MTRSKRFCAVCAAPFYAVRGRNHVCSEACRRQRGTYASRKASAKAGAERIDRIAVFERDGWTCYLCGNACLRGPGTRYKPRAPVIDHVVPLSKGGEDSLGNVRCAHDKCNRIKHDKLIGPANTNPA